jgi:hypothetical protein
VSSPVIAVIGETMVSGDNDAIQVAMPSIVMVITSSPFLGDGKCSHEKAIGEINSRSARNATHSRFLICHFPREGLLIHLVLHVATTNCCWPKFDTCGNVISGSRSVFHQLDLRFGVDLILK